MTDRPTPERWIHFSTANHPDRWDTEEFGVIQFANNEEAKKAETLFNTMERDRDALREQLAEARADAELFEKAAFRAMDALNEAFNESVAAYNARLDAAKEPR